MATDKSSKWYKGAQNLWDFIKKYGDAPVKNEDDVRAIYDAAKKVSEEIGDPFTTGLLIAFVKEKERERTTE